MRNNYLNYTEIAHLISDGDFRINYVGLVEASVLKYAIKATERANRTRVGDKKMLSLTKEKLLRMYDC